MNVADPPHLDWMRLLKDWRLSSESISNQKRCRAVIEKEMRYKFEKVVHLIDSETVLNQINRTSYRFKIYEGVRIGEIQAATTGNMSEWAWLPGKENIADLLTRGCAPIELDHLSTWQNGPPMLSQPFEKWNIKFGSTSNDPLPGEKKISTNLCSGNSTQQDLITMKMLAPFKVLSELLLAP